MSFDRIAGSCATGPKTFRYLQPILHRSNARPGQPTPQVSPEGHADAANFNLAWQCAVSSRTSLSGLVLPLKRLSFGLSTCLPISVEERRTVNAFYMSTYRGPLQEQLTELTAAFEERYLRKALKKTRGHVGQCAEICGLSRRSITDKIAQYSNLINKIIER